jgi:thiamine pyrophosphate-dependent acetolactate synthase large subunit-like protein
MIVPVYACYNNIVCGTVKGRFSFTSSHFMVSEVTGMALSIYKQNYLTQSDLIVGLGATKR